MTITDGKYQIEVINNGKPKFVELKKYKAFKNGEIVMFDPTGTGEKEKWYAFDDHMYKDTVKLIKASNLNNEPYKELIVDSWQYPGRSLTLKELGKLTGKTNFDTFKDGAMYLDKSLNWLFDQTGPNCEAIGCPTNSANANNYGYWLAETVSDPAYQGYAWVIDKEGRLNISQVNAGSKFGFRPVITVPKNIIS